MKPIDLLIGIPLALFAVAVVASWFLPQRIIDKFLGRAFRYTGGAVALAAIIIIGVVIFAVVKWAFGYLF